MDKAHGRGPTASFSHFSRKRPGGGSATRQSQARGEVTSLERVTPSLFLFFFLTFTYYYYFFTDLYTQHALEFTTPKSRVAHSSD